MSEITIKQIAYGADGDPANLANGIELPIDNETLDKTMMCMKVKYPYTAYTYTFRLEELNAQITGAQPLDKLNSFAARLTDLSEYERVKFEGAVLLSQENMAEILGLTPRYYAKIENEGQYPSFHILCVIERLLQVPLDEFFLTDFEPRKTARRRGVDSLIDRLSEHELKIIEGTIKGVLSYKKDFEQEERDEDNILVHL